jgi:hypothetical protein
MTLSTNVSDLELVSGILERTTSDLAVIIDRPFRVADTRVERAHARAVGQGLIHISFKLRFRTRTSTEFGCMLIPLPEAITLANYLMMLPDEAVAGNRDATTLDRSTKDALLELGNFIGGACDAILRSSFPDAVVTRSEGCQGVRAEVRPAFPYTEGNELLIARASARIHDFPPFELILMLPALP